MVPGSCICIQIYQAICSIKWTGCTLASSRCLSPHYLALGDPLPVQCLRPQKQLQRREKFFYSSSSSSSPYFSPSFTPLLHRRSRGQLADSKVLPVTSSEWQGASRSTRVVFHAATSGRKCVIFLPFIAVDRSFGYASIGYYCTGPGGRVFCPLSSTVHLPMWHKNRRQHCHDTQASSELRENHEPCNKECGVWAEINSIPLTSGHSYGSMKKRASPPHQG